MTQILDHVPGRCRYSARWLVPVDVPPIENGTIEIEDGQIIGISAARDPGVKDLGNVAVVPGLINAHTHLEFSELPSPLQPAAPFADWIRHTVAHRRGRSIEAAAAVRLGCAEAVQSGTTLVAEIATAGWSTDAFAPHGVRAVVFRELIGLNDEQIPAQVQIAEEHLNATSDAGPVCSHIQRGLSPHAPYTVHPKLYEELIRLAHRHNAPVAVHLAETEDERRLLAEGRGDIVDLLRRWDLWDATRIQAGTTPLDYLRPMAGLSCGLIVHGNYLSESEIDFIADHPELTVVYCPRTHAFFGHADHPWLRLIDRGIRVCFGTDGRASNPDLSIWNELLFLRNRFPHISATQLLHMTTLDAAHALGVSTVTGSLTPGKRADLTVIQLSQTSGGDLEQVLLQPANHPAATLCHGHWLLSE